MENENKTKSSLRNDYNDGFLNNVGQTLADAATSVTGEYQEEADHKYEQHKNKK